MSEENEQPKISLEQRYEQLHKRLNDVGQHGIAAALSGYHAAAQKEIDELKKKLVEATSGFDVTVDSDALKGMSVKTTAVLVEGADVGTPETKPAAKPARVRAPKGTSTATKKKAGK